MSKPLLWNVVFTFGIASLLTAIVSAAVYSWQFPTGSQVPSANPIDRSHLDCGPESLRIALARIGIPVDQAFAKSVPYTSGGVRMGELEKAGSKVGAVCQVAVIKWQQLTSHAGPVILFVNGQHFVVADPREKMKSATDLVAEPLIRVYDPDGAPKWFARSELEKIWHGECLTVSRPKADDGLPNGVSLSFPSCWMDAGDVGSHEQAVEFVVPITNAGTRSCTLTLNGKSCSCTRANLTNSTIEPGQSTELKVRVALAGKRGYFAEHVEVATNDQQLPRVQFVFCGVVIPNTVSSTDRVYFASLHPNYEDKRTFFVHALVGQPLEINTLIMRPKVDRTGVTCNAKFVRIEKDSKYVGSIGRRPVTVGDYVVELKVKCAPDCQSGDFEGAIEIQTSLRGSLKQFSVGYEGSVDPDLFFEPKVVLLRCSAEAKSQFSIRRHSGREVKLASLKVEGLPQVSAEVEQSTKADTAAVVLTFMKSDSGDSISRTAKTGRILVRCDDGSERSIPVVVLNAP